MLLKDIADVQIQEAKEYVKINANGREGVLLAIIKQPNANLIDVANQMEAKGERTAKNFAERCYNQTLLCAGRFCKRIN